MEEECSCVCPHLLIHQADRPAKSKATHTLAGNGTYHAHFGISGDVKAIKNQIPSCSLCHRKRLEGISNSSTPCPNGCRDWVLVGAEYPAPKDYPKPEGHDDPSQSLILKFKNISFLSMRNAIERSHEEMSKVTGGWSVASARAYLRVECVENQLVNQIVDHSRTQKQILAAPEKNNEIPPAIENFELPASLRTPHLDIGVFVCTFMHHIFL
jgi:hypothetical protein